MSPDYRHFRWVLPSVPPHISLPWFLRAVTSWSMAGFTGEALALSRKSQTVSCSIESRGWHWVLDLWWQGPVGKEKFRNWRKSVAPGITKQKLYLQRVRNYLLNWLEWQRLEVPGKTKQEAQRQVNSCTAQCSALSPSLTSNSCLQLYVFDRRAPQWLNNINQKINYLQS